jgi:hypothetical protein
MLIIQNKQLNTTFERIVRDKNGVLARIRFIVVEVDGRLQAQIISVEPFIQAQVNVLSLPAVATSIPTVYIYQPSYVSRISPYFFLDFFMSQPTRAPSL